MKAIELLKKAAHLLKTSAFMECSDAESCEEYVDQAIAELENLCHRQQPEGEFRKNFQQRIDVANAKLQKSHSQKDLVNLIDVISTICKEVCNRLDQLKLALDERCRVIEMQLKNKEQLQAVIDQQAKEIKRLKNQKEYIYKDEIDTLKTKITQLISIFDHPNHDNPKRRYLYEIKEAIKLLKAFSQIDGGGEYAYGVAQQLEQFIKRAEQALLEKK